MMSCTIRWSSRKRRVVQAPAESATGEMIFPGPRFPPKSPKMGEGQFFSTLPQKMPILFHSGNKRQFKLCSKSVSNYQNQLVEAEKLFKKSHIFAWFHCTAEEKDLLRCPGTLFTSHETPLFLFWTFSSMHFELRKLKKMGGHRAFSAFFRSRKIGCLGCKNAE